MDSYKTDDTLRDKMLDIKELKRT